jgi:hypothetical protein
MGYSSKSLIEEPKANDGSEKPIDANIPWMFYIAGVRPSPIVAQDPWNFVPR